MTVAAFRPGGAPAAQAVMRADRDGAALAMDTPVLLLGGAANAVAVARHLGRRGAQVAMAGDASGWPMASRFCRRAYPSPPGMALEEHWAALLLGAGRHLDGHVLIALCDDSIAFLCRHHAALSARYRVEPCAPDLGLAMLDKRRTLELARQAGLGVPGFWTLDGPEGLDRVAEQIAFPVMVKPIHSHLFIPVFGAKLFICHDLDQARAALARAAVAGIEVMLTEMIPGGDDLLSSYYTCHDDAGQPLFHYTKRVIRRFPVNRGGGCYHESLWLPETAEAGRRFFGSLPWRGIGNIEFKRDPRDGVLKVIEVNARLTAAHRLVLSAGMPMDLVLYAMATGQCPPRPVQDARRPVMWNPPRDLLAGRDLVRAGQLTWGGWLRSLPRGRVVWPMFEAADPGPSLRRLRQEGGRFLSRLGR